VNPPPPIHSIENLTHIPKFRAFAVCALWTESKKEGYVSELTVLLITMVLVIVDCPIFCKQQDVSEAGSVSTPKLKGGKVAICAVMGYYAP
jgi:hypothetical protein